MYHGGCTLKISSKIVNIANQHTLSKCHIYLVLVSSGSARCRLSPASPLHHWSERSDLVILRGPTGFAEVSRL